MVAYVAEWQIKKANLLRMTFLFSGGELPKYCREMAK